MRINEARGGVEIVADADCMVKSNTTRPDNSSNNNNNNNNKFNIKHINFDGKWPRGEGACRSPMEMTMEMEMEMAMESWIL